MTQIYLAIICIALITLPTAKEEGYAFSTKPRWRFSQVKFDHIKRAVNLSDWESAVTDLDVNEQISVYNETKMR